MTEQTNTDIDYEQMDDLPITEHFEWHLLQIEETVNNDSTEDQSEWQAA